MGRRRRGRGRREGDGREKGEGKKGKREGREGCEGRGEMERRGRGEGGGGGRERAVEEVSLNIGILEPLTISHVIFVRLLFPQMIKAKIVFLANGNKSNLSPPE